MSSGRGGGFVADGAYVRGVHGRSGELGFMTAGGGRDTVQASVSLSGLAAHLARAGFAIGQVLHQPVWEPAVGACLDDWVEQAARTLCTPLDAINCLIDPAVVLIGGRLPSRLVEQLAERVNALIRDATAAPAVAPVRRAALSEDAPAVGAAILPFSHFLLPKAGALWKDSGAGADVLAD